MVNTSELRLGNILKDENGKLLSVGHIQDNFYGVLVNGKYPGYFQPIPLTDEWLKRLELLEHWHGTEWGGGDQRINGYKLTDHLYLMKNKARDASGTWDGLTLNIKNGVVFRPVMGCEPIRTVHRLQNVFFCLTGKELPINQSIYDNTDHDN